MEKKSLVLLFVFLCTCFILSGCGKKAPGCADEEVVAIVMQIAEENSFVNFVYERSYWDGIEAIRTQSTDAEVGSCSCAANLRISWPDTEFAWKPVPAGTKTKPIEYTVERTTDDGRLYVSVYGL